MAILFDTDYKDKFKKDFLRSSLVNSSHRGRRQDNYSLKNYASVRAFKRRFQHVVNDYDADSLKYMRRRARI